MGEGPCRAVYDPPAASDDGIAVTKAVILKWASHNRMTESGGYLHMINFEFARNVIKSATASGVM